MKKLLPFLLFALLSTSAKSQSIPNPGFENWILNFDYSEPEGWGTLNLLATGLFGNPVSVFKDSVTPYSGTYAMNVTTIVLTNNPDTANLRDTAGIAFTGSVTFSGQVFGFPYTQKPTNLRFYYKYFPTGTDTAFCNVQLFKWNTTTNSRDTLATGTFFENNTVNSYTQASILLDYDPQFSSLTPDTAMINYRASSDIIPIPGSSLFVDELSFSGGVGVEEQTVSANQVTVFPNPANSELNLKFTDTKSHSVLIYDASGKVVAKGTVTNKATKINVAEISNGLYFYKAFDKNNGIITSGKFNIAR